MEQQKFSLEVTAVSKDSDNIEFHLKVNAECNLPFVANAFAHLIKEDENLKAAMAVALLDSMYKENGRDMSADIESMLNKSKVYAQA